MQIRLATTAHMSIVDHEAIRSNETATAFRRRVAIMSDDQPSTPILNMEKGVGGEVRVELDISADVLTSGDTRITGEARLFEGTSEQTNDLDGTRNFDLVVPLNRGVSHSVRVRNDDEGGDHALITLTFRNEELDDTPPPSQRRRVSATATLEVVDHETFGSNEVSRANATRSVVINGQHPASLMVFSDGAGGEVRVEVDAQASLNDSGDAVIEGMLKLFEGTSEQTTDLDGEKSFSFLVPRDGNVAHSVTVRNDAEGGDHATCRFNVSNVAA